MDKVVFKRDNIGSIIKGKTIYWLYPKWFWDWDIVLLEWDKNSCDKICKYFSYNNWRSELSESFFCLFNLNTKEKFEFIYKDNMTKVDFNKNLDLFNNIIKKYENK